MALKKGFLRSNNPLIDRVRLSTGILLGLAFSFGLYSLFIYMLEIFRLFINGWKGWVFIWKQQEHFALNFFYASIASIVGLSVFFKFAIEGSVVPRNKRLKLKQRTVLTNQSFTTWHFLNWFGKVVFLLGLMYITLPIQYDLQFLKDYLYLLFLLPLTIFLNLWPDIIRILGRKAYQWMGIALLSVCGWSFILVNIDLINYQKINEYLEKRQLSSIMDVEPPHSSYFSLLEKYDPDVTVFVGIKKMTDKHSQKQLAYGVKRGYVYKEILPEELPAYLKRERHHHFLSYYWGSSFFLKLYVDQEVSMEVVNWIKHEARKAGINRIGYNIIPLNTIYPAAYPDFKDCIIGDRLPEFDSSLIALLDSMETLEKGKYKIHYPESRMEAIKYYNRIKVRISNEGKIYINQQEVELAKLKTVAEAMIRQYPGKYVFILEPSKEIPFAKYIEVRSTLMQAISQVGNSKTLEVYKEFSYSSELTNDQRRSITKKIPYNIVEWSEEELAFIKLNEKKCNKNE